MNKEGGEDARIKGKGKWGRKGRMEAERRKERQEGKIGGTQLGKGRREGGEEGLWKVGEKEQWRINES